MADASDRPEDLIAFFAEMIDKDVDCVFGRRFIRGSNRKAGVSKLELQELGSRYLFIVLYCFLERWLSRGDYKPPGARLRKPTPRAIR